MHILQLLSIGAFANAIESQNTASCFAPGASSVSTTGTWTADETSTSIPGTLQNVLVATVPVGTSPANAPTLTWNPYVSASGNYEVYLMIPGCINLQDCGARTSLKVTVFPGNGIPPSVTTVSERVNDDTSQLIYRGPVVPTIPDYRSTVSIQLADSPTGTGQGGQYHLVADRVQFVLTSTGGNSTANGTTAIGGAKNGYGFFEWPLSASAANATGILSNSTQTPFDALSFQVPSANATVRAVVPYGSNPARLFAGGQFSLSSGATNIAVVDSTGAVSALAGQGLNGAVSALAVYGGALFVGGGFTDTQSGGASGLRYVARYDVQSNAWSALGSGLGSPVTSLEVSDEHLLVGGEFGLARWNLVQGTWVASGGYVSGTVGLLANSTAENEVILAGQFSALRKFGANGWAVLENGPNVRPLGVLLDQTQTTTSAPVGPTSSAPESITSTTFTSVASRTASAGSTATARARRRSWFSHMSMSELFPRQQVSNALPAPPAAVAPAVLAGAFWSNSSIKGSPQISILGGNFTFGNGANRGIAFYDSDGETVTGVQGAQVQGVVRTLLVRGDELFVGGEFTVDGAKGSGLATYGLKSGGWEQNDSEGLVGESWA